MYTFVCQKVEGNIIHDFVLATVTAVSFANWFLGEEQYRVEFTESIYDYSGIHNPKIIPVGSVEFVGKYYSEICKINNLLPYNVPKTLIPYGGRKIWFGTNEEKIMEPLFCKSMDTVKGYTGFVDVSTKLEKGNYQYSEIIEIDSEWRCFVYNGRLLSIHNYINSLGLYPCISLIQEIVGSYSELDAYTLDVGVSKEKGTFIIEVHDFYSCGLYGFRDHIKLLQMLIASHNQKLI